MQPHDRLRAARVAAGLSQQELATLCGMGIAQISRLERGTVNVLKMRVENLLAMADVLDVDPLYLVGDQRKEVRVMSK